MRVLSLKTEKQIFEKAQTILSDLEFLGGKSFSHSIINDPRFSMVEYESGETVYSKKEYKKALSLIVSGKVTARKVHGGKDLVIRTFDAGDLFGVAALFSQDDEYVSEIRADSKCTVAFVSQEIVSEIFLKSPEAALAYVSLLSQKIRYLNNKLDNISAPSALSKLCYFLIEK